MISVSNLRYRYRGADRPALDGLSFDVRAGEVFGFLGPSGAGKSTTQKILTGLLRGYTGELRILDSTLDALGRGFYERIGVSFEFPNVYQRLTGRENLELFASLYAGPTERPDELLALVGLGDAADQRVSAYSKGMRMRLNFCRALLANPPLLFLDEPTSGQDPENARRLRRIILDRRGSGATVFLTTHDMTLAAELCDRVAFLVDGRITTVDAPRALMVRHGRRQVRVELHPADARDDGAAMESLEFDLDGIAEDARFLGALRSGRVASMHTLDATLEDVFLAVTGRRLA